MTILGWILRRRSERRANGLSYPELKQVLIESQQAVGERFGKGRDSASNLERARHITGIERWGQSRMRTALGAPLVHDEYNGYRPDDLDTMAALTQAFMSTRDETLAIVDELQAAGVSPTTKALHNELGEISLGAWVYYLNDHGLRESLIVRS
ncbi:hypothetical protein [Aggregatilinea lenta]|uniref:hypothetical protein n=1 Tax=Aggregatilinea lenta TaxID=913108 RepID=UPI000E5A7646|nr:hypothetical protein [Aggregatilinea lenta]